MPEAAASRIAAMPVAYIVYRIIRLNSVVTIAGSDDLGQGRCTAAIDILCPSAAKRGTASHGLSL